MAARVLGGGAVVDGENDLDCRKDLVLVCLEEEEKPLGDGVCRRISCC